ncbi:MAG: S41 family peptidase [Clostridiales bacterium]|nr:S41 family peptidase [Clostridiales bacterium]
MTVDNERQQTEEIESGGKKKKNSGKFWKGVLVGFLLTVFVALVVVGAASGIFMFGRSVIGNRARIADSPEYAEETILDMNRIGSKLSLLQAIVNEYFLFDEDMDQVEAGIYKGMMDGLDDPYTVYYTAEEYESLSEETEGVYVGIGVLVSQDASTKTVTALRVFSGSGAEEAGMKKGDIFYAVGEVEASTVDLDVLVKDYIKGEEGTWVDITVIRDGEPVELHIQRRMVETTTVEYQLLDDGTGYILVTQFDVVTGDQFAAAIDELEAQGMERLVIDMRDNPGGVLDTCVQMAAYVLPEDKYDGTILTTATKAGDSDRYYCEGGKIRHEIYDGSGEDRSYPREDGHEVDVPIAILLNGNSASAAEVFSGALQDYGAAVLVGTTSFGKGIVQSLLPLDDGSAVKITVAHYYTPSGFDLHGKGLTPDIEVELELDEDLIGAYDVPLERDNQVQAAIEAIR